MKRGEGVKGRLKIVKKQMFWSSRASLISIFDQFKGLADLQVGEELHADEAWKSGVVR